MIILQCNHLLILISSGKPSLCVEFAQVIVNKTSQCLAGGLFCFSKQAEVVHGPDNIQTLKEMLNSPQVRFLSRV